MPIEWTERTWNPITGCSKTSPGCRHCYAILEAIRKQHHPKYEDVTNSSRKNWTGRLNFSPEVLAAPYHWRTPQRVFVNSMSDLFHEDVPFKWIVAVFKLMNECPRHQFQILTKRSDVLKAVAQYLKWTSNIWQGVSVENADYTSRIDDLRGTPAAIKWISAEPLLGPLDGLNLTGIDWVVTGGLSGGDAPEHPQETELVDWVRSIRDQCIAARVAFFHKQWGGRKGHKKENGRMLDGKGWMEYPHV
jgi:protein gp37